MNLSACCLAGFASFLLLADTVLLLATHHLRSQHRPPWSFSLSLSAVLGVLLAGTRDGARRNSEKIKIIMTSSVMMGEESEAELQEPWRSGPPPTCSSAEQYTGEEAVPESS